MPGPRQDDQITDRILSAACDLIAQVGYPGLTLVAVAERAGTSRPALYRRFPDRTALTVAALVYRFGDALDIDTGDLRRDLERLQEHQRSLFNDVVMQRGLPGLVSELAGDPDLASRFVEVFLAPRRRSTIAIVQRAVDRGEISAGFDGEWVCDLVTGPMLMRAVLPGLRPIDQDLVDQTVRSACAALGLPDPPRPAP